MPLGIVGRFFVDIILGTVLFIGIGAVAVGLHWLVKYLDHLNTSGYITVMLGIVAYITFTLDVLMYLTFFVFSILLLLNDMVEHVNARTQNQPPPKYGPS
jgi:hypothetical protein